MRVYFLIFLGLSTLSARSATAITPSTTPTGTAHFYTKHSYDVLKYKLDIGLYPCFFAPFHKTFSARQTLTFRVDSVINTIVLNAINTSLAIDSVRLAGISFSHVNDSLKIRLNRTYQPGEIVNVSIFYRHFNVSDKGFFANDGSVYTDSPPEGARKWMPCWDRPSDKATWELNARVPVSVRLGSNGRLADSTISGDTISYHWVSDIPISTYLITLSSKVNYQIHNKYWHKLSSPDDSVPVRIYYTTGENIEPIDTTIIHLTDYFSEKFGDYPFEKIGFATMNATFPWGGMENQTMVNLMPDGYKDDNLIAHEHSHQWFGDLITCGTWADIWLNEGFGTYCQNLWVEHSSGFEAYRKGMISLANFYLAHNPGWALYHPEWAIHTPSGNMLYNQAISYNKGACVLFQLRNVLGDSIFFQAIHEYITDTNLMFNNVYTHDFVEKTNKISGKDLSWFFDEWVYSPNHPVYRNTFCIDSLGENSWRVTLILSQVQPNPPFFKMPVEIRISFSDASDSVVRVTNDANHQEFVFTFSKRPMDLIFDPHNNILLKQAATVYSAKLCNPGSVDSLPSRQAGQDP